MPRSRRRNCDEFFGPDWKGTNWGVSRRFEGNGCYRSQLLWFMKRSDFSCWSLMPSIPRPLDSCAATYFSKGMADLINLQTYRGFPAVIRPTKSFPPSLRRPIAAWRRVVVGGKKLRWQKNAFEGLEAIKNSRPCTHCLSSASFMLARSTTSFEPVHDFRIMLLTIICLVVIGPAYIRASGFS